MEAAAAPRAIPTIRNNTVPVMKMFYAPGVTTQVSTRIGAFDRLRGLIIVLMAIDHASFFIARVHPNHDGIPDTLADAPVRAGVLHADGSCGSLIDCLSWRWAPDCWGFVRLVCARQVREARVFFVADVLSRSRTWARAR